MFHTFVYKSSFNSYLEFKIGDFVINESRLAKEF